jgi:hypothetical protein
MSSQRGTSRRYLIRRLRREGRLDLAEAVERDEIAAYAVACALGWQRRQNVRGTGSTNQAKRRAFRLRAVGL